MPLAVHAGAMSTPADPGRRAARTVLCAVLALLPLAVEAATLPDGATLVTGRVLIERASDASTLTLRQQDAQAIVDWRSFDIGAQSRVDIIQPASTATLLNRVTGDTPSTLAGTLSANGVVLLVNPNGISIASTGIIDAAGFIASTLPIDDADVGDAVGAVLPMAARQPLFLQLSDDPMFAASVKKAVRASGNAVAAPVVNHGIIRVQDGGVVAMLGTAVSHGGQIVANAGRVSLLGTGDGTTAAAAGTLVDAAAAAPASVAHQTTVDITGSVQAHGVDQVRGEIRVEGGSGKIKMRGVLDAYASHGRGGGIVMSASKIDIDDAIINAAGAHAGGHILLSTTGGAPATQRIDIGANGSLFANADYDGEGGTIHIGTPGHHVFRGTASADGAAKQYFDTLSVTPPSARGGAIKLAGEAHLLVDGSLSARPGRWADSDDFGKIRLTTGSARVATTSETREGEPAAAPQSLISATSVTAALHGSHVYLKSTGERLHRKILTIASPLHWCSDTSLSLYGRDEIVIASTIETIGQRGGVRLAMGPDGGYGFQDGSIALSGSRASLSINGIGYALIRDAQALAAVMDPHGGGYYALARPIDLAGQTFKPLENQSGQFFAHFEGLGNAIRNLRINEPTLDQVGLFRKIGGGAVVSNLSLAGAQVTGGRRVGVLAGEMLEGSRALAVDMKHTFVITTRRVPISTGAYQALAAAVAAAAASSAQLVPATPAEKEAATARAPAAIRDAAASPAAPDADARFDPTLPGMVLSKREN